MIASKSVFTVVTGAECTTRESESRRVGLVLRGDPELLTSLIKDMLQRYVVVIVREVR